MKNWQYVLLITDVLYKGHSKRNEPEAFKEKRAGVWNVQTGDNIVARVTKSGSDKSAEVHCPPLEGHGCKSRDYKLAHAEIQVGGHPPSSPDLSPSDYAIFGPLKRL